MGFFHQIDRAFRLKFPIIQFYEKYNMNQWYPLVNIQKAIENGHRNSGLSHEKW